MTEIKRLMLAGIFLPLTLTIFAPVARGQIFVSIPSSGTIQEFTTAGVSTTFTSGLNVPEGLAFDSAGLLYVANGNASTIIRFPTVPTPGVPQALPSSPLYTGNGLFTPEGLVFSGGLLYVANGGGSTIRTYPLGNLFSSTGVNIPYGITFDATGNLYVANGGNNTILMFPPGNSTPCVFASGLSNLRDLTWRAGVLYVAAGGNTILEFAANGSCPGTVLSSPYVGVSDPRGLAFDCAGNLYVTGGGGTLMKFSAANAGGSQILWTNNTAGTPGFIAIQPYCMTLTCATNKTVQCGSSWTFDLPTATNGCSGTNITFTVSSTVTNGICPQIITRTWTATDACSNSATCSQTVTVVDTTPPTLTCATNKTVQCGSSWTFDPPTGVDACSGTNVTVGIFSTVTNGICPQVITRIWLASDLCGNTNICSQIVTVVDTTPPTLTCSTNKTVQCGSSWTFDPPTGVDACSGTNVTVGIFSTVTNGICPQVITRTWLAVDLCGNTNTCSQTVTVNPAPQCLACATWTSRDTNRIWYAVASSANGNNLVAVEYNGYVYSSADSGVTWMPQPGSGPFPWRTIASDATGQNLVAAENPGQIYTSVNNGATWVARTTGNKTWQSVASDATGQYLVAVADNDYIYTSANYGTTWTAQGTGIGLQHWHYVASDSTGKNLVAVGYGLPIYTSSNYGVTWTAQNSGSLNWQSVASSSDGSKLVAGVFQGPIYTSGNAGVTWTQSSSGSRSWDSIASSSDGSKLVAVSFSAQIYCSTDSGVTWTPHESGRQWVGVAASSDASKMVAVVYGGGQIYTAACAQTPVITCATNKTVQCGSSWSFDPPTIVSGCSGTNNITVGIVSTVTNGICPQVITRTWLATDACTNSTTCSQTVTVVDTTPPTLTCSTNKTVQSGSSWTFDPPTAVDACSGTNVIVGILNTVTNGICPQVITRTWLASDLCGNTNTCSQTVTVQCATNGCVTAPTNMVLWLPFDETSGTNSANYVPGGNNGTQVGGPVVTIGYVDHSLSFSNSYVNVPDYPAIDFGTNDFSIDAWVKRAANDTGTSARIIVDKRISTPYTGYAFFLFGGGTLAFELADGTYNNYYSSFVVPNDGQWHHVAVTVARHNTSGIVFYLDGVADSVLQNPVPRSGSVTTTAPLRVGSISTSLAYTFFGGIDEVELFSRALGSNEIATLFNAGSAGKCKNPCAVPLVVNCTTNKVVQCGISWSFDAPTATGIGVKIAQTSLTTSNNGCASSMTQSWLITDTCGDSNTCSQTVTVVDTTKPVIISCPTVAPQPLNTNCNLVIPQIGNPLASDICPLAKLSYSQYPTNGTIVPGPNYLVTLWVADGCGNSNYCQVMVVGQNKTPPVVLKPNAVTITNCIVPVVTNVVVLQNCTTDKLMFSQSPLAGTTIAPGVNQVTVTVTDLATGLSTQVVIPLLTIGSQSFLNVMFNTGVDPNKVVLPVGSVDPHYTLGPVPALTPTTGLGLYVAPKAIVAQATALQPFTTFVSRWIGPASNTAPFAFGNYTYTNQFTLPSGADPTTAVIQGRWATDDGGTMYLNGLLPANQVSFMNTMPPGYGYWTAFIANSTPNHVFLPFPQVNKLYFVVSNAPPRYWFTGLRVEYTNASFNCSTCAPPSLGIHSGFFQNPTVINGSATFSEGVGGTPPLTIQWYRNSIPLSNSSGHYPGGVTNSTLTIYPVVSGDGGNYSVIVSNACGSYSYTNGNLNVNNGWVVEPVNPLSWAAYKFAIIGYPMKATVGPDLMLDGTNILGISSGTTLDYGLPGIYGQPANVMDVPPLPGDTYIQLPFFAPTNTASVTNYTLVMDVYVPIGSMNPITLFELSNPNFGGQDGLSVMITPGAAGGMLSVVGTLGGLPFEMDSSMPLTLGAWNRIVLVVNGGVTTAGMSDPSAGGVLTSFLNGAPVGSMTFDASYGALAFNPTSLATLLSSPEGTAGESYVSSIEFFDAALPSETIASFGSPDNGPVPNSDPSAGGTPPVMSATTSGGTVNFSWTGSSFKLQETSDLASGVWMDSTLPFDETVDANGVITTTAHANPPLAGQKFYRVIYAP